MDKLIHKLNEELVSWVSDLVTNSDLPDVELLSRHSYEYCIKKEIIDYFDGRDDISDDFIVVLMGNGKQRQVCCSRTAVRGIKLFPISVPGCFNFIRSLKHNSMIITVIPFTNQIGDIPRILAC